MESVYHIVTIRVNETSWAHIWRLRSRYLIMGYDSNDQEGDEDDGDKEESNSRVRPPHPRVRHNIQRDHPVNNILGDIEKGVTNRSRVAIFCEHYSFVSCFKPLKV
jgi:hypothetical protein